ncbi:hypothetical protein Agub_g362 [Astrephomene gubernaculifera]|uniref:Uncharacterized protein n=1 Tax=Astrephomene gubernaculifera TaxID=47775 RepID=A0AAD3DFS8_9CHLO|nr:hypothetical protein Agub_g362 [Astrephomene gubernaculifera]
MFHKQAQRAFARVPAAHGQASALALRTCTPVLRRWRHTGLQRRAVILSARMHVPADSFSGQSPERKAAVALRSLFTFVAARVVLEQLQGPDGPTTNGHTSYNQQAYLDLMDFLGVPMKGDGGDEWLAMVMRKNHALALRLMEVREAYQQEFEWQQVAEMACRETREANMRLMRAAAMASLQASLGEAGGSSGGGGGFGGPGEGRDGGQGLGPEMA